MNKIAEINRLLNLRFDKSPIQVWGATVKSVQGTTCTVDIAGTDLRDVPGVALLADSGADADATDGVLLTPKVGSFVYVSTIENSLDNLYVCHFSEVSSVGITIENVTLAMDKKGVGLKQDQVEMRLESGRVSVKNAGVSLKDLFSDLTRLLNVLKVITPVQGVPTPSTMLDPATTAAISRLTTKVNQLLH